MEHDCPVCNHPNEPMGTLGSRVHYRCRACGIVYSRPVRTEKNRMVTHGFGIETVE